MSALLAVVFVPARLAWFALRFVFRWLRYRLRPLPACAYCADPRECPDCTPEEKRGWVVNVSPTLAESAAMGDAGALALYRQAPPGRPLPLVPSELERALERSGPRSRRHYHDARDTREATLRALRGGWLIDGDRERAEAAIKKRARKAARLTLPVVSLLALALGGCALSHESCPEAPDPSTVVEAVPLGEGDCGAFDGAALRSCVVRGDPGVCGIQWDCYGIALDDGRTLIGGNVIGRDVGEVWFGGELDDGTRCGGFYSLGVSE